MRSDLVERVTRAYIRHSLSDGRPHWLIPFPGESEEALAKRERDDVERWCNEYYYGLVEFILAEAGLESTKAPEA